MAKRAREESDATSGLTDEIINGLHLRRIIKENHSSALNDICLNRTTEGLGNLVVTVGGTQANVYDNEHFGDFLDLVSHFKGDEGVELTACCWVPAKEDAYFALGASTGLIQIVSLTQSCVLFSLKGHSAPITQLFVSAARPSLLFSVSRDDTIRVWSMGSRSCIATIEVKATAAAVDDAGKRLLVGTVGGDFVLFPLADDLAKTPIKKDRTFTKRAHNAAIDAIAFIEENRVLSKSVNGRMELWDLDTEKQVSRFAIKGTSGNNQCRFGLSYDRKYVAVGDSAGAVAIFSVETGTEINDLRHKRSRAAVRACAFAGPQGRSILYVCADGSIWRYDYIDEATLAEWARAKKNINATGAAVAPAATAAASS